MPKREGKKMPGPLLTVCPRLRGYRKKDLLSDLLAGATVAVMLVPQAMAYASLAGLPPVVGLYASTIPLVIYALFGSSRHLAIGPVAIISMVVYTRSSLVAEPGTPEYINAVLLLCAMIGIIQVMMGLVRLGFLVNFLSHAVISGLTSAAAILIALSQLKHLLGISGTPHHSAFGLLADAARHMGDTRGVTLLLGLASIGALVVCKRRWPRFPASIVVVLAATLLVRTLRLDEAGVSIVGVVPGGLPRLTLPGGDIAMMRALLPAAFTIVLIGFVESISIAKVIAIKERYHVNPNRELGALGLANLATAFFSGYPVTGGFSRTAVNHQAGARTAIAALVTAALVLLTLLFFTPLFYYLPNTVLAAIVIVAVADLVDFKTAAKLFAIKRYSGASLLLTFAATLALGVEKGVLMGIIFSLLVFVWRSAHPHTAELGFVDPKLGFRNVKRYPDATTYPGIVILRVDASLYFANMAFLEELLRNAVHDKPGLRWILMDFSGVNDIDGCAVETLEQLFEAYHESGIDFALAGIKGPVRDVVERAGWRTLLGQRMSYATIEQALNDLDLPVSSHS